LQWPPLAKEGFRFRPRFDVRDEGLRRVLLLMGPGTFGLAATQINVFVNTLLATGEGTGAVSWLDYAFRLMYLPIGLFGVSIATAATPAVSRLVAVDDRAGVRSTVASSIGLMLALNVPSTLGLIVLGGPIIGLIFQHGSFGAEDTAATAAALRYYALGLVGYSIVRIVTPTFYALHRSRIPVAASAMSVVLNIVLNVTLVRVMGYRGLALGTSLTALVNAAVQLTLLRTELGGVEGRRIAVSLLRITAAALPMAATAWGVELWLHGVLPGASIPVQAVRVGVSIAAGVGVLTVAAHVFGVRELAEARALVLGRLRRGRR
ncbi:MAG: murein biosynthesis integral membrane protein MurJ, partial [Vicinamibacterales bacterium]